MRFPKLSALFSSTNAALTHHLITTTAPSLPPKRFPDALTFFCRRFFFLSPGKTECGSLTKAEESVHSWLYAIAQSDKFLAFEYVQSTERGLSFKEADRRLKEMGPNVPLEDTRLRWWCLLWNAFFHPFNIILIVLSILSYVASDSPNGFIMLVLVFISISLRFSQEFSSSKAAMQLSEFVKRPVRVQRCAGRVVQAELTVQVDQRDVVPGDIVVFQPGDLFPGDVRLLSSKHLVVSQSSLTGESGTVDKTADIRESQSTPLLDLKNICFMGTSVVSGSGTGLIVSTGSKTYIGTMFSSIGERKPADDFERGIRDITYGLIVLMLLLVTIIFLGDYLTSHDIGECILFGISVASALTPQMLPLVVNTSLAKGALAMARHRCIVKSANAIRDMGSMDILCMDKTGTLTTDHGIVVDHLDGWGDRSEEVLRLAFLNSYFTSEQRHPLDEAILAHVYTGGYRFRPSGWTKLDEIPFDFVRRRVSVVLNDSPSDCALVITKGALEEVLSACSFMEGAEARVSPLTLEHRQRVLALSEDLRSDGLRVIGVAVGRPFLPRSGGGAHMWSDEVESGMSFVGLVTFFDPPKDSGKHALRQLAEKGVKAKVLTGDSLLLAVRVCREVGMETEEAITGPELELLGPDAFHSAVERATVLARLTPTQKLRAVRSLQAEGGHVVGFLGDGLNDSLALDAADVGVSVDSGASVAKDRADIILLENDLSVLAAGVERGRATFANTVKYVRMSAIANVGSALSLLLATAYLRFEPLTPRQLLVQSFLYNSGQMAIPWDSVEEEEDGGGGGPSRWSMKAAAVFVAWNAPVCCLCDVGNLVFLWFYYGASRAHRHQTRFVRTALFTEGLMMQVLVIHLVRTRRVPFLQGAASWQVMSSTALISAVALSLPFTPVGAAMGFVPLPASYFAFLLALFFFYFCVGQVVKIVYIRVYNTWL